MAQGRGASPTAHLNSLFHGGRYVFVSQADPDLARACGNASRPTSILRCRPMIEPCDVQEGVGALVCWPHQSMPRVGFRLC